MSSTPYAPPWSEGVRNLIRSLAQDFSGQQLHVTVVCPETPGAIACGDFGERVVNVAGSPAVSPRFRAFVQGGVWVSTALAVRHLAAEIDVVLLVASLTSALGQRTVLLRKLSGLPLVIYVTGLGRPRLGYSLGLDTSHTLVGSQFLRRWLPGAGVVHPTLPIDLALEGAQPGKGDGTFNVLYLGSFEPERGVQYLLQAMALVREGTERQVRLILAWNGQGCDSYESIQRQIDELGIRPIVDLRGRVDTGPLYGESDIVVIPRASQERMSFPIRIVEALHMGKPLVVSRMCGMEDLVDGCGLAVEPRDAGALAGAMLRLISDTQLREDMIRRCATLAKEYDRRASVQKLVRVLRMAVDGV